MKKIPETIGKNFFKGIKIPLEYVKDDNFLSLEKDKNFFSIIFAVKGNGVLQIDKKNIPFITPTLFCFNEKVQIKLIKKNDLHTLSIFFLPSFINDNLSIKNVHNEKFEAAGTLLYDLWLLRQIFSSNVRIYEHIDIISSTYDRLRTLIDQINEQHLYQKDPYWPCRGRSYFIELLILIEKQLNKFNINMNEFPPSKELDEVYSIILYLNNSYQNKITINDLSKQFNTNRTSLTNKFIKATGYSPINYLIKHRINIAIALLQDTSIPITEIINRIGFDDLTHFGRMFKKYTGVNPSTYRDNFKIPSYINI